MPLIEFEMRVIYFKLLIMTSFIALIDCCTCPIYFFPFLCLMTYYSFVTAELFKIVSGASLDKINSITVKRFRYKSPIKLRTC